MNDSYKKNPSMEEMIEMCEKKKRPDQEIVFAVGAGRIVPQFGMMRKQKKALKAIKEQKGFIGVHPVDLWHTLLIFDTLNNAKGAKNELTNRGMQLGNVAPILVDKAYLEQEGTIERY